MEIYLYSAGALAAVAELLVLFFCFKSGKPIKNLLIAALCGIAALIAVNLTARFTGVHIPVNPFSVGSSALFGIPAVCGMVIMGMII